MIECRELFCEKCVSRTTLYQQKINYGVEVKPKVCNEFQVWETIYYTKYANHHIIIVTWRKGIQIATHAGYIMNKNRKNSMPEMYHVQKFAVSGFVEKQLLMGDDRMYFDKVETGKNEKGTLTKWEYDIRTIEN
ncbi:hypothetical protein T08_11510 [Trichinella sp. T8]|nr:hypothetical protein T08_11510 [Trichinella sp. T8]